MANIYSINPATGKKIKGYKLSEKKNLDRGLLNAERGFSYWRKISAKERCKYIRKVAKILLNRKNKLAEAITIEMGKPITQAISEIEKCAWCCNYYADYGVRFLENEIVETENKRSYIRFDPLGIILSIMPWNFPFWQVFRFGIPSLTAGNVTILKHSNVVPECSLLIHKIFQDANFPNGVFQSLITDAKGVGYLLPKVNGVSLTGSVETGISIATQSSKNLKKFVLELGGSDPFIVLDDANIKFSCENASKARFVNTGQSCIAAKRFIVTKKIAKEFTKKITALVSLLKIGDPLEKSTDIGPLVRKEQLSKLENQVRISVSMGAKILCGGKKVRRDGYFYLPTVLTSVKSNMPVIKEEVFGPVLPILVVANDSKAINEANNTEFGLGASIWSRDIKKAEEIAKKIEAGVVSINSIVKSDPRLPFGGIKKSGIGRELSRYGLLEFCNIKAIVVN